ncbi:alpha/beta fold hydrolase [Frankia sp. AgB1.9]|uniref:alpha/beta fold hydrolase n=1 Tax=unclassified Frankia TaxID=2632575 RepID=UPI00193242C2|nr:MULTISPECIES: alpha/beta fold hydrolase [unclassified Frankia]MBL7490097.1 alpha/beta fold hydrolase [Frankia sp. AgW1.1]MBL7551455.1 alpha/beta fold hydrolase [Frankia sp. AgB1.9]MBL7617791.1 alpha/beta fold hydrolase [Frankia sp. AgB1.8]
MATAPFDVGRALTRRVGAAPATMLGLVTEAASLATHVAFYPAGVRAGRAPAADRYSLAGLAPLQRGLLIGHPAAAGMPILLVHGLVDNRSIFARLQRTLRRRGFGHVETVNLPLYAIDVPTAARMLAVTVTEICGRTGYQQVHVVAHSLGGLVARYYVQRLAGDERVHTLVTLGTPHGGTRLAHLVPRVVPYRLVASLRPGSPLLTELAEPASSCGTRFLSIGGGLDSVVRPESAALNHPDLVGLNVTVPGLGHHSLPFNGDVAHGIAAALADLDGPLTWLDQPASHPPARHAGHDSPPDRRSATSNL